MLGLPVPVISEFVEQYLADVVVMGTVHRVGIDRLIGSNTEQALYSVPGSILAVGAGIRGEHDRAIELTGPQKRQCLIGVVRAKRVMSQCTGVCCKTSKPRAVFAGQVGHRTDATLAPQQAIRKAGMSLM